MDDQSARTGAMFAARDTVFIFSGKVVDNLGAVVPNHAMKAALGWWQFDAGVSTKHTDTIHFVTGDAGLYSVYFHGLNNPIVGWDDSTNVSVTVGNDGVVGWVTNTPGGYIGKPTGASPITIPVTDTVLQKPDHNGG